MLKISGSSIVTITDAVLSSLSRLFLNLPFSWRGISALILGVLLAKWFWIFFAPAATFTANQPERAASVEAGRLFGVTISNDVAAQSTALPNVQLIGIFAASGGKKGFAILKLDNQRQAGVAEGEEISSGVRLVAIQPDHILLESAYGRQRVNLENKYRLSPHAAMLPGLKEAASQNKN